MILCAQEWVEECRFEVFSAHFCTFFGSYAPWTSIANFLSYLTLFHTTYNHIQRLSHCLHALVACFVCQEEVFPVYYAFRGRVSEE